MMSPRRFFLFAMSAALLAGCAALPPSAPEARPVSDNSAVIALMDNARSDIAAGKPDSAVASLERALRIEPRNPLLWQELARLRQAWAGSDKTLRAQNWRLIGESRLKRGDHAGAQAAFDTAAQTN